LGQFNENNQKNDLYSRDLQTAKDALWVRDEFVKKSPVWIDAQTIAYVRQKGGEMQVVRNYQGQAPQVLYTSTKPILQLSMINDDSQNLFFLETQNNELIELKSLNLRNGNLQNWRDTIPDLPNKISQLQYSPKPNTLLGVQNESESPAIVSLDLHSKNVTPINSQFSEINKIAAINDHAVLVVGSLGAAEGIWFVDEQKPPQLVLRRSGSEAIVDAQIDTKRNVIFYANLQKNIDIKMISVHQNDEQLLPELNSSGMDIGATFANHKFIYFISNRTGLHDIWRYDTESKSVKQISTLNALSMTWYALSHDGKSLAIGYRADDLYLGIVDVETGELRRRTKTPSHRYPLAWSLDDKSIYASEHQAKVNLYNYDATTLQPSLFASESGLYVKALDGNRLIYVDYTRHALIERNLTTQQEKILHNTIPDLMVLSPGGMKLNKTNDGFYTACQVEWVNKTCFYSLASANSSPVVVSDTPYWQFLDITEDGEAILAADVKPSSGDIMKMQLRE
jgi:Tol biopolymer transport system component